MKYIDDKNNIRFLSSKKDYKNMNLFLEDSDLIFNIRSTLHKTNKNIPSITVFSNFLNDYSWRIDEIIPEIDMSNLTHSIAIVNFFGCLIILLCLITIISSIYGTKLILYLDLENKYPSLAKFIRLRIKFQNYTILFNFALLSFVLINQMIINLIVLFTNI